MEKKVGIILPIDPNNPDSLSTEKRNLHGLFEALTKENIDTHLFLYNDTVVNEIEPKLGRMDAVLVWVNPIENQTPRTNLDAMLLRLSKKNIFVSTHPDTILKIGTKEVLLTTKELSWGSDVEVYNTRSEMTSRLLQKLQPGISRVLKQYRGNGGRGVWRIEFSRKNEKSENDPYVKVLLASRNSTEQEMTLSEYINTINSYFDNSGKVIDQEFFSPEPDGMIRCYMSQETVVGFGQHYVKSLVRPKHLGEIIQSPPRIYYPKEKPEYQDLRKKMEEEWIPELEKLINIDKNLLPVIWDADFLYRPNSDSSNSQFVLCEVNVSSVFPFPETAVSDIVLTVKRILQ